MTAQRSQEERDALVLDNLYLVHWTWKRIRHSLRAAGLRRDDALGAGMIGLILAAEQFDPGRGTAFSTYAHASIQRHMRLAIDKERLIHLPQTSHETYPTHHAQAKRIRRFPEMQRRGGQKDHRQEDYDPVAPATPSIVDSNDSFEWLLSKAHAEDRPLLDWYYREGADYLVIAQRLGVCKQRVQQRIERSLKRLHNALRQKGRRGA